MDNDGPLTVAGAEEICLAARNAAGRIRTCARDKIFAVLEKAAAVWSDPNSAFRREAQERLPGITGFSPQMVELGLNELPAMLDPGTLERKLATELRGIPVAAGYKQDRADGALLQYQPLGTVFHVLSGNVFLVGPGSFIEGLITGNASILKMSNAEKYFMPRFMQSLIDCDKDAVVSSSAAIIDFASSQTGVIDVFKKHADCFVLWGGEDAVRAYRDNLPARTRVVVFGPKLSFAVVTRMGFESLGAGKCAGLLAREIALWDQNACTAPQACFVEGAENAKAVANALVKELEGLEKTLPPGRIGDDVAVEIRKLRSIAEISEARGAGLLRAPGTGSLSWTVIVDEKPGLEPSPLHRTIRIMPYRSIEEVENIVAPLRGYLQTLGYAGSLEEVERFSECGVQRIFELGRMHGGDIDDPHDGQYDLPQLLNLVVARGGLVEARLQNMIRHARKCAFYSERLKGIDIRTTGDLKKIPPLDRATWEDLGRMHPGKLATRNPCGGYVTRSGGSTGIPKFSCFDKTDWEAMIESATRVFCSCGFDGSDHIANFMSAGDLYGSFISFNHVNYALGAVSYCFCGALDPGNFMDVAKRFGINAVQGLPNVIMPMLRKAKELDASLQIEKIMYAGQPMGAVDRRWLRQECKTGIICSIIGTTEANHIGYQCGHCQAPDARSRLHHTIDDYNWIEILDDGGNPAPDGTAGRIAVTGLQKTNYPVIRYLIGDAGRIVPGGCACGSGDRLLEYLGRWDDIICIGKLNISYLDVRDALAPLDVSQVQLTGSFVNHRELLTITVESAEKNPDGLRRGIIKALAEKNIFDQQKDNFLSVEIRILPPGSLPRNVRTGKTKNIIDERQ